MATQRLMLYGTTVVPGDLVLIGQNRNVAAEQVRCY
jgi:hypothetical protein